MMAVDEAQLRTALGHFPTGVTVVSTRDGDLRPYGVTVSSFASLSLDPPLVQWSIRNASFGYPIFTAAETFAVNVLAADQEIVSQNFCKSVDRFATVEWEEGYDGLPLIHGCLAWIECGREGIIPAGDHHILVGRVIRARTFERPALLHWKGRYAAIEGLGRAH